MISELKVNLNSSNYVELLDLKKVSDRERKIAKADNLRKQVDEEWKHEIQELKEGIKYYYGETQRLERQVETLSDQVRKLTSERNDLMFDRDSYRSDIEAICQVSTEDKQLIALQLEVHTLKAQCAEKDALIYDLQQELERYKVYDSIDNPFVQLVRTALAGSNHEGISIDLVMCRLKTLIEDALPKKDYKQIAFTLYKATYGNIKVLQSLPTESEFFSEFKAYEHEINFRSIKNHWTNLTRNKFPRLTEEYKNFQLFTDDMLQAS